MSSDKLNEHDDHDVDDEYFDEFGDESSSDVDGDWDDVEGEESYEPPPKKKKSMSNVIIIGVAVVAGLIFMVFKFGGSSGTAPAGDVVDVNAPTQAEFSQTSEDVTPVAQMPTDAMTATPEDQSSQDLTPTIATETPGPLTPMPADMAAQTDTAPAPLLQDAPVSTEQPPELMTSPDMAAPAEPIAEPPQPIADINAAPVEQPQSAPEPAMIQPVSDFPSADMIKKVETAPAPDLTVETAPVAATEAPAEVPPADAPPVLVSTPEPVAVAPQDSAELNQALDKIKELQGAVDKNNQVIQGYEGQISDLKDKVSDLETKLEKANQKAAAAPVKEAAPVKKSEAKTSKEETVVVRSSAEEEDVAPVEAAPVKWVLKGAQSGRALLAAADQKQADVKTVSVGDKVSGLGTILSIEKGQSGWVVLGTIGKVTE